MMDKFVTRTNRKDPTVPCENNISNTQGIEQATVENNENLIADIAAVFPEDFSVKTNSNNSKKCKYSLFLSNRSSLYAQFFFI